MRLVFAFLVLVISNTFWSGDGYDTGSAADVGVEILPRFFIGNILLLNLPRIFRILKLLRNSPMLFRNNIFSTGFTPFYIL